MNVTLITSLCKLLGDGLFAVLIAILYVKDRNKRQKEYEEERKILEEDYKKIKEAREQEYQNISENYNKMITDIVNGVNEHHLTPEESKSIAQVEKQINDIVKNMLVSTNASRVCIVKYHNGSKDMTGVSFLKMSMTNEAVNIGVAPLMQDFQNHFRSLLAYWCHEIDEKGECLISNTEDLIDKDITMYEYLKTRKIEAKYGVAIRDAYRNVIGFICVEYLDRYDFKEEKVKKAIKENQMILETLISLNGGGRCEL